MLSRSELAEARKDFAEAFLTGRCQILRKGPAEQSSLGGSKETFIPRGTPLPCRLDTAKRQREDVVASGTQSQADITISLPWGTVLKATDRLSVNGTIYDVTGTDSGRTDALCLTVPAVKVSQG